MWHEHGIGITSHAGSIVGQGHDGAVTGDRSPSNRQPRSAASYCPKRHGAGISAQAVITERPRRWPLRLIMKPSQAGVESACT